MADEKFLAWAEKRHGFDQEQIFDDIRAAGGAARYAVSYVGHFLPIEKKLASEGRQMFVSDAHTKYKRVTVQTAVSAALVELKRASSKPQKQKEFLDILRTAFVTSAGHLSTQELRNAQYLGEDEI